MEVKIPCVCGKHDAEDTVWLADVLGFHQATTITKAVELISADDPQSRGAEVLATLSEYYLLVGIERWTLRDAQGKPLEVTKGNIRSRILSNPTAAGQLVEVADGLYQEAILLPLVARASTSSQPSRTDEPTSPTPRGTRRPKPLKPSSTFTTQTGDIETTSASLAGDSSFSPSSESAA